MHCGDDVDIAGITRSALLRRAVLSDGAVDERQLVRCLPTLRSRGAARVQSKRLFARQPPHYCCGTSAAINAPQSCSWAPPGQLVGNTKDVTGGCIDKDAERDWWARVTWWFGTGLRPSVHSRRANDTLDVACG